jgi:hypothetical protein
MGYAFTNVDEGYRYMLGLGAIPGVLILIVTPFMKLAPLPIDGVSFIVGWFAFILIRGD